MILANNANQCGACLAQEFDLHSVLNKGPVASGSDIVVHQCRQCRKYERGKTKKYEYLEPESPELLSLCLRLIPALSSSHSPKLHLVDAMWVWTEPHSMRFKVRLTVRTEVMNVTIQQRVLVELYVKFKQCQECNREYTNRTWHALVQLRQKRNDDSPRKGLRMVEMALARHPDIRKQVLSVDASRQGFDFYFMSLVHAQAFAAYLARIAPMRIKTTKKLVSTDVKSNTANLKHTVACDMVPLCRDDLVMVHKSAKGCNIAGRICLVTKMSSTVHLVDGSPRRSPIMDGATMELSPETYYKSGGDKHYLTVCSSRRMIRFVVLDVEMCQDDSNYDHHNCGDYNDGDNENKNNSDRASKLLYKGPSSGVHKFALADVQVARESDMGHNNESFCVVTHLGNLLQVGDVVMGYDMVSSVLSGVVDWSSDNCFQSHFTIPDVVLVKKIKGSATEGVGQGNKNGEGEDEDEDESHKKNQKISKRKERRKRRNDKKARELSEAATRMGFVEEDGQHDFEQDDFEQELENDPELEEELNAAEREFTAVEEVITKNDNNADAKDEGTRESNEGNDPSEMEPNETIASEFLQKE